MNSNNENCICIDHAFFVDDEVLRRISMHWSVMTMIGGGDVLANTLTIK